ncbi:hypothetical protein V8G54_007084 [Vigna mungo]|uniref:Transposase-associated domain-containing protein n=1 Tax=Vigna mungo TaxID=3915 RepID=A0AAQ3P3D6_VIGMU
MTSNFQTFGEGVSTNRPPLFAGENYPFWKIRMQIFLELQDKGILDATLNGHFLIKVWSPARFSKLWLSARFMPSFVQCFRSSSAFVEQSVVAGMKIPYLITAVIKIPLSWEALCYYCVTELFYYLTAIKLWNLIVLKNGAIGYTIRCPCPKCGFMKWHNRVEVEEHLILKQIEAGLNCYFDAHEQIEAGLTQSTTNESEVSPNDVVGKVLGPEHSGRVRCMGLGAAPTNAFRNTRLRISYLSLASSTTVSSSSSNQWQQKYNNLESTLKAYMIMKEGKIPDEFTSFFDSQPQEGGDANEPESPLSGTIGSSGASNI